MADVPINVTLGSKNEVKCHPDPAHARKGMNQIIWSSATPGVTLEAIDFETGPGKPVWPGSNPSKQPDGRMVASDPVSGGKKETFKYSVTVRRGTTSYTADPEVVNDPGG